MSQCIVDAFETIEIHAQHRRVDVPAEIGECLPDPFVKHRPVRQPGQGIVACHMGDLRVSCLPVRHVLVGRHPSSVRRRIVDDRHQSAVRQLDHHRPGFASFNQGMSFGQDLLEVATGIVPQGKAYLDDVPDRQTWPDVLGVETKQIVEAPVDQFEASFGIEHADPLQHVAQSCLEPITRLLQVGVLTGSPDRIFPKHLHGAGHHTDLVTATARDDGNRKVALGERLHNPGEPAQRAREIASEGKGEERGQDDQAGSDGEIGTRFGPEERVDVGMVCSGSDRPPPWCEEFRIANLVQRDGLPGLRDLIRGETCTLIASDPDEFAHHVGNTPPSRRVRTGDEVPALEGSIAAMCDAGALQVPGEEVVCLVVAHGSKGVFRSFLRGILRHEAVHGAIVKAGDERPGCLVEMLDLRSTRFQQCAPHVDERLDRHEGGCCDADGENEKNTSGKTEAREDQ